MFRVIINFFGFLLTLAVLGSFLPKLWAYMKYHLFMNKTFIYIVAGFTAFSFLMAFFRCLSNGEAYPLERALIRAWLGRL